MIHVTFEMLLNYYCITEICKEGRKGGRDKEGREGGREEAGTEAEQNTVFLSSDFSPVCFASTIESALLEPLAE